MAIFTKNLDELINNAKEKKQKVENQISSLKSEKSELNTSIEKMTNQLVEYELEDNQTELENTQKDIEKLRSRLLDVENKINAYQRILDNGVLNEKESEKIRVAIQKERKERSDSLESLNSEKEQTEKQIDSLENRIKEIKNGVSAIEREELWMKNKIENILDCIDPRAEKISWHQDKKDFVEKWIGGSDTESFFKPKPKSQGFRTIERTPEPTENDPMKEVIPVSYTDESGTYITRHMTREEAEKIKETTKM